MCKTMPPSDGNCGNDIAEHSPRMFRHDFSEEDDGCCKDSSESLEDTLSLTCDDSMESSSSSDTIGADEVKLYHSPDLLRRRLLPIPPSPILEVNRDTVPRMQNQQDQNVSKKRRSLVRLIPSALALTAVSFLLAVTTDFRRLTETVSDLSISEETRQWKQFFHKKAPKLIHKISRGSRGRQYTMRIRGNRLDLMLQSLDYHSQCPSVQSVQVEWIDSAHSIPASILHHKSGKIEAVGKPATPAVFLLDEDILLTCDEMERAFIEWRLDPTRLVGFYPFHHSALDSQSFFRRSVRIFEPKPVSQGDTYSMLSDQALFVHNYFLRGIPNIPQESCRHLALSIIVSRMTSKPPSAVMSNPHLVRQRDASMMQYLQEKETSECQQWIKIIGGLKLPDTTVTIVGH